MADVTAWAITVLDDDPLGVVLRLTAEQADAEPLVVNVLLTPELAAQLSTQLIDGALRWFGRFVPEEDPDGDPPEQ